MERPSHGEGWFYKQNSERFGPVSSLQLREMVASGQLQPRQAVWQQSLENLFFVRAGSVAFAPESEALDCRTVVPTTDDRHRVSSN
jgi:GYF domain 2